MLAIILNINIIAHKKDMNISSRIVVIFYRLRILVRVSSVIDHLEEKIPYTYDAVLQLDLYAYADLHCCTFNYTRTVLLCTPR